MTSPEPLSWTDGVWVAIDVAALALGVGEKRAYQLSKSEGWRTSPGKPRGYLIDDIKKTARQRKTERTHS